MGLLDFLFGKKPSCEACGEKVEEVVTFDERELCPPCRDQAVEARKKREAEIEARRIAEEKARAALEDKVAFGRDPRKG